MSIPKEPRQLMINLMYLVLTALLALNVSAEIINAFFLIDKGIAGSNAVIDQSNEFAMTVLGKNAEQDEEKYGRLVEAAKQIQTISQDFSKYVTDTRDGLVDATGQGYFPEDDKKHPGQPKAYKNKDVTTRILVNEGKGAELKDRILGDREKILEIIGELSGMEGTAINDTTIAELEKSITLNISDDWENSKKKSWEDFTFNHMPVASVFPIFTKFKNDMKSSEAAVLNFLVNQVGATSFKVDAFIPISSATKSYIIAGESYDSKITIGASSKSVYENMIVKVDGKTLDVENGVADYSVSTSSTGVKKYKVDITLTNPTTGKTETYSEDFEYEVGRRSVTVSADKMNVFYIGVDNPVSVVAAGVSSNELRVSGSGGGLKLKGRGNKYTATVTTPGVSRISVSGGGLKATSFEFRAKRIPDPMAMLGKSSGGPMGNGEFKAQGGVLAILDGFDFDARCNIQGFNLTYVAKRQDPVPVANKGPAYSAQAKRLVQRAKPGDIYYFDNVRARCPGDKAGRKINAMVFTIK
jgi:gliding motility-associated protein GldM